MQHSAGCHIGDEGATHLAKSSWGNLKCLKISNNDVNKDDNNVKVSGLESMAAHNRWKELEQL